MAMHETEYLLTCLSEECSEVAHRVSKAIRFTREECEPGQNYTNAERIVLELADLIAVMEILIDQRVITDPRNEIAHIAAKKEKVERFMDYSEKIGALLV
jgi:NTP pyrophosphatase (non-canonical NTP hydrolase)